MATNEVEIEVVLEGAQQATKELKNIGQAGKSVAESMRTTNEKLGEGFTSVADGVESVVESVGGFSKALSSASTAGAAGLSSLLGPVALLTSGVVALYEAFQAFSGASQKAERRSQAMAAAASDLQTKLESLSEKGVTLTTDKLKEFTRITLQSQIAKELLQQEIEDSTKAYSRLLDAQERVNRESKKELDNADITLNNIREQINARSDLGSAMVSQSIASLKVDQALDKTIPKQRRVNELIKEAAEQEKEAEELSAEALQAKAKEEIARLKNLKLLDLEALGSQKYTEAKKAEIDAEIQLLQIRARSEEKKDLQELNKSIQQNINLILEQTREGTEAAFIQAANINKVAALQAKADQEERERQQKRAQERRQAAKQREAMERQRERDSLTQQARIEALRIQLESEGFTEREQLATLAYQTELQLAEDNADKKLEAELRYQLKLKDIGQARIDQSAKEAQKIEQDRLKAEAQAAKERDARERQAEAERQRRIEQAKADYQDLMSAVDHYSSGLANAAAGALLFGDSVSQGVADALNALASEAAVNALIETAKGVASAFTNPAESATHFTAAGQFAVAATAARGASALLGGGGGGGVTAGASSSPSGAPQTASAPVREEAREAQITYNINFGGSVIYDSKRAAEQALADRITTIQNTRRRGAPIPRRA